MCPSVGYSGHERGIAVSLAAIALGAEVIERHITEDRNLEGPDHQASLTPPEFSELVKMGVQIEEALGPKLVKDRNLSQGALLNKENLGKSIVAADDLVAGTKISRGHLSIKSPGQGMSPLKIDQLIGKRLRRNLSKDDFIFEQDFKDEQVERVKLNFKNFRHPKWGIPVRPHDIIEMHTYFDATVYEFHISYKDLKRSLPDEDWSFLSVKTIVVHAPELFENSKLLDLCSTTEIEEHIKNLSRVCDFTRNLRDFIGTKQIIPIVTNIGGFSTHEFRPVSEKETLYRMVKENLSQDDETGCEITIQNMSPFPRHYGGQRYQNIFSHPIEIADFCSENSRRITLDTAHLSMYCTFANISFIEALKILMPHTAHLHMSDARGLNGEGVKIGTGDIDFQLVLSSISNEQSFIVETWQGHKNRGEGFKRDLNFLIQKEV